MYLALGAKETFFFLSDKYILLSRWAWQIACVAEGIECYLAPATVLAEELRSRTREKRQLRQLRGLLEVSNWMQILVTTHFS